MARLFFPALALSVLLVSAALTGCSDDLTGPQAFDDGAAAPATAAEFSDVAAAAHRPRVIVLFEPTILDPQAFLRRYSFLRRYAFLRRYDGPTTSTTYGVSAEVNLSIFSAEYCDDDLDDDDCELDDAILVLEADDDVRAVEDEVPLSILPNPLFQQGPGTQLTPWGITRIGADVVALPPDALDGVDFYVFDTALLPDDLDLVEQVNDAGYPPGIHGYHVAGIAAAEDDTDGVVGVAPGVNVRSFAVLDKRGQALLTPVILAIEEVRRRRLADPSRPVVVNMSFGADIQTTAYNALDAAVEAAIDVGVVVVVSAGNDGIDAATVTPAHVAGALTVGAYDPLDQFASFSNYGPVVDLLAPGVDILSLGLKPNGTLGLSFGTGTSAAAPHVAGAAAVYLALNPTATPAEVEAALIAAGLPDITNVPGGTTNRTVWLGDGF